MPTSLVLPHPSEKQKLFLKEKHKYVAFGGARGGGKSFAIRIKAILLAQKHAGIRILIVRRTYKELEMNHISQLKEMLKVGTKDALAKYNKQEKIMYFPNGSIIQFDYCASESDIDHYQGGEWEIIFIDEATQMTEDQLRKITACMRGANNFPKRCYFTCNPGGVGMAYIKRLFIERNYLADEDANDYAFIQSLVTDNKALMKANPDYIRQLKALPPKLKKAWLEGDWDILEGVYFDEFRVRPAVADLIDSGLSEEQALEEHRYVHVIKPFEIPSNWKIYRSYDWGYGKPFSCGWWAQDFDGCLYRILELYGCTGEPNEGVRWSNKEQFDKIAQIEREHRWLKDKRIQGVADPSIWDGSRGISAAEEAEKHQLWFEKGVNDRIPGWMQVRERMKFDENGKAMIYIFDTCKDSVRTIPLMMHDKHNAEDLDSSLEDHAPDDIRYMCMMRPIPPRVIEQKYKPISDPLNQVGRYSEMQIIRR